MGFCKCRGIRSRQHPALQDQLLQLLPPGFWEKPASDHDDTQCMSAADLDDLAGKFRVSASAIDEAALSEIGMVHSLRFISE